MAAAVGRPDMAARSPSCLLEVLPGCLLAENIPGRLSAGDIYNFGRTCRRARSLVVAAVEAAGVRLYSDVNPSEVPRDPCHALRWLRETEAKWFLEDTVHLVDTPTYGTLPPPRPAPSGCKFEPAIEERLIAASVGVRTGGRLSMVSPLGSVCFLDYAMVLENDGPPCQLRPGIYSFIWVRAPAGASTPLPPHRRRRGAQVRTVVEITETYVPPHLRGARVGAKLAEQAPHARRAA